MAIPSLARLLLASVSAVLLPAVAVAQNYYFSTLAGLPVAGAADGTGSAAQFNYPNGGSADAAGNVFFADTVNHVIRKVTPAGVVSTVAGKAGVRGSVDGPGADARFDSPTDVAVAADGTLYVAGNLDHTVRMITPAGVVSTIGGLAYTPGSAEDGDVVPTVSSRFNFPRGVAVVGSNVYVADAGNHRVRRISSTLATTPIAGTNGVAGSADGVGGAATFNTPTDVAVTTGGVIYVVDSINHTIRQIAPDTTVTTLAGQAGASGVTNGVGAAARFNNPARIALDDGGTLYVADAFNNTIRRITMPGAAVTTLSGQGGFAGYADGPGTSALFSVPSGVAVKPDGTVIYALDSGNNLVRTITPAGATSTLAGATSGSLDGTGPLAKFDGPTGVGVSAAGVVVVGDTGNHIIRKVTGTGVATTFAGASDLSGSTDGFIVNARFNRPRGIAVATDGTIYVADSQNHTIRKITTGGTVTTLAGLAGTAGSLNGTGSAALFNRPSDIAISPGGTLYVADSFNHTIRVVTAAGVVTTLAGMAGSSGTVDGTGSTARFTFPVGVAVNGNAVFVADTLNHTIRKVTFAGVVTTVAGTPGVQGASDGTGVAARFSQPQGIAAAADDTLFIADTNNNTIRRVSAAGVVTTIGGEPGDRGSLSGTGAAANFNMPIDIALGAQNTLYIAEQGGSAIRIGIVVDTNVIQNSGFDTNGNFWLGFATPDSTYLVSTVTGGVHEFYRRAPPVGTTNQAVTFQETNLPIPANGSIELKFKMGNSDTVRKRISVLVHDASFADLAVCTFWLPASAPIVNYSMRTHTTQPWASATVSFYAATANAEGNTTGRYRLDDVSMAFTELHPADRTICPDANVPTAPGGAAGSNLIVNGTFDTVVPPWSLFGQITGQITSGVFEFVRTAGTPAGVILQQTGAGIPANQIVTALFQFGNSSGVRKRVTVLLHDSDFSDLSACTFFLAPGQPLQNFEFRTYATTAWANATLSVYGATTGTEQWIRLDNVSLRTTPAQSIVGTECLEPAAVAAGDVAGAHTAFAAGIRARPMSGVAWPSDSREQEAVDASPASGDLAAETCLASGAPLLARPCRDAWSPEGFRWHDEEAVWQTLDDGGLSTLTSARLRLPAGSRLQFESWLTGDALARILVSIDGVTWDTLGSLSASDTWMPVDLEMPAHLGAVWIRLSFESSSPDAAWRVRE